MCDPGVLITKITFSGVEFCAALSWRAFVHLLRPPRLGACGDLLLPLHDRPSRHLHAEPLRRALGTHLPAWKPEPWTFHVQSFEKAKKQAFRYLGPREIRIAGEAPPLIAQHTPVGFNNKSTPTGLHTVHPSRCHDVRTGGNMPGRERKASARKKDDLRANTENRSRCF